LTVPYWNWGPEYVRLINSMIDGSFVGEDVYFDVDSGSLGLLGFMEGETVASGVPEDVIPLVQETLAKMQSGEMNRFSIFTGPINDNKGNEIVPAGSSLTQSDLEGLQGIEGREDCTYCMNWLVEGVVPDAEIPQ
jgi:basic membrane protein A